MLQAQDWEKQGNPQFYREGSMGCPITSWNMSQQHHTFVQNHLEMKLLYKQKYCLQEHEAIPLLSGGKAAAGVLPRSWAIPFKEEENQWKATKTRTGLWRQDWINSNRFEFVFLQREREKGKLRRVAVIFSYATVKETICSPCLRLIARQGNCSE